MEEEDTVYYRIYPDSDVLNNSNPSSSSSSSSPEDILEELKTQCLSIVWPIAEGYIWQHEPFNLRVCSSKADFLSSTTKSRKGSKSVKDPETESLFSEPPPDEFHPHLAGRVKFGDNLEDEWLVVYLVFEISRRIPTVSITVRDADGEFLLIEAAYFLPKWVKPETSHNRIFTRQGALHFIQIPKTGPPGVRNPKPQIAFLKQSLQILAGGVTPTRAPPEVQNAILERIAGYPEKAQKNMHRVRCKIPVPIAHVLTHEPQLISLAVEAFYTRDIDSMKAASAMKKFLPKGEDGGVELVDVVVRMSKAMYAQLVQQVFQAPKGYPMPKLTLPQALKEAEIGMKIAVGFEMLYWERSNSEDGADGAVSMEAAKGIELPEALEKYRASLEQSESFRDFLEDSKEYDALMVKRIQLPKHDPAWTKYRASLEQSGYFRGLLEGSKEFNALMQRALDQYRSTDLFARVSKSLNSPAKRIDDLLSMPFSVSDYSSAGLGQSDDDSWLYNGEEDLTAALAARQKELDMYESRQGNSGSVSSRRGSASGAENWTSKEDLEATQAAEVVRNMQSFVNKISSFEGAEIPAKKGHVEEEGEEEEEEEEMDLDMSRLMKELGSVFNAKEISEMMGADLPEEESDASSDLDLDESTSGSEDEMEEINEPEMANLEGTINNFSRAAAATDRVDRAEDVAFSDEYSHELDKQLRSSSLAKSFATRREVVSKDEDKASSSHSRKGAPKTLDEDEDEDENDAVEVDMNLVQSMLQSYMFQQGMPGPGSNLLGAMGVQLPDNSDERAGSYEKPKK